MRLVLSNMFKPSNILYVLLTVPMWGFFCESVLLFMFHGCLCYVCSVQPCDHLAFLCVMFSYGLVTFLYSVLGLVWGSGVILDFIRIIGNSFKTLEAKNTMCT